MILLASTDLDDLIRHGDLKNLLSQIGPTKSPTASSSPNPPAFIREKGPDWFSTCFKNSCPLMVP